MASSYTLSELTTDVATLTGSPTFTSTTRVTSAQVTYWLGQAIKSWSALMRQKFPEDRELIQSAQLSTVADFRLVSLPADCGEVHSVVWIKSADEHILLESFQQGDLAWTNDSTWDSIGATPHYRGATPHYRVAGQTLELFPTSSTAETIEVYYTSHLSSAGPTVIAKLDFDRWVTLDVAIRVFTAKSQTARAAEFQQQKALLENDLLARARKRDVNKTQTIRDTRAERFAAYQRKIFS